MGFVYVVSYQEGTYKIGSTGNLEKRLSSLQTGHFSRIVLNACFQCEEPKILEAMAHVRFSEHRISGEWFEVDLGSITDWFGSQGYTPAELQKEHRSPAPRYMRLPDATVGDMPSETFSAWVTEMRKLTGLSDSQLSEHIGLTMEEFARSLRDGTSRVVSLACRALLHRLEPYS